MEVVDCGNAGACPQSREDGLLYRVIPPCRARWGLLTVGLAMSGLTVFARCCMGPTR